MGKGIKEFKRAMKDTTDEIKNAVDESADDSAKDAKDKKNEPDKKWDNWKIEWLSMNKSIDKNDIEKIAKILSAEKITFEKDH